MSKTVEDLVKVFMQAADDTYAAEYIDPADTTNVAWRAGIAAVIMAVRDHLKAEAPHWSYGWGIIEVENELNEILGDAGEKVAGGSTREDERSVEQLGATSSHAVRSPATDPAPAVCDIKELVKRLRAEEWATAEREKTRNAAADALEAMAGEVAGLKEAHAAELKLCDEELVRVNKQWSDMCKRAEAAEAERDRLKAALRAIAVKAGTSECGGNYVAAISLIGDLEQMADAALRAAAGSALEAKP